MDTFQKSLKDNKEAIVALIKLFHPNFKEKDFDLITVSNNSYDWITIKSIKRLHISLGVSVEHGFIGSKITLKHFQDAYNKHELIIKAWRFWDDKVCKKGVSDHKNVTGLLQRYDVKFTTPMELFEFYFKD